jgi:type I restriction enzyme M protein
VLDKENAMARKGIFMIDASKGYMKDGPKNRLRDQDVHKIVDTFTRQDEGDPRYARMVSVTEISDPKNDFNLNLPRYIDSTEPEDIQDINGHLRGGIPDRDIDDLASFWHVMPAVRAAVIEPAEFDGYSGLRIPIGEVKAAIFGHPEFTRFNESATGLFNSWKNSCIDLLKRIDSDTHPKLLIQTLSEDLLAAFSKAPLLDHYDIYQHLMDYWAEAMQDDCYLIVVDGWREAAKPQIIIVDKNKKTQDKPDFVVGKRKYKTELIPSALIIARYFRVEQAAIEKLEIDISAIGQELEELIEANVGEDADGEPGVLEKARDEKTDKLTKASVAARLRDIKGDNDADDEQGILTDYLRLSEREATANAALKGAQESLMEKVLQQYGRLTEDDIKTLVVDDKWLATLAAAVQGELDHVSQTLTGRIRQLAERYATPLPQLTDEVATLAKRVEEHLTKMGAVWK